MSYYYGSNNALAMYIDGSGAVGFGTSNTSNMPGYVTFSNPINVLSGIQNPNSSYTGNVSDGPGQPSFTWYDTSNYGMFRASNNIIGFSTSSTEAMRIDNLGRVGIGKSNPQYILDISGPINALGYCNLLSNVVNSTSIYTAPTNNALNTVNLQSTWGCNLAVNTSNIVFNPSSNPNNVQGNFTSNLAVTSSNQLYPIAIYSSNYISSNTITFSNLILNCNLNLTSLCNFGTGYFASNVTHSNTFSNLGNAYFASNLNVTSLCNFSTSYFASNVTHSNTFSNLGNAYFASNIKINSNVYVGQNGFIGINNSNAGCFLDMIGNQDLMASFCNINGSPFIRFLGCNGGGLIGAAGISNASLPGSLPGDIVIKSYSNMSNLGRILIGNGTNNPVITVSNAYVGIGTMYPQNTLDVTGVINSYTGITNSGYNSNFGNASFSSNVVVNGNLIVSQNILCSNTFSNFGNVFHGSNVVINSNLTVMQNIFGSNSFSNFGNAYFASNMVINSNLTVLQNITGNNLTLNGNLFTMSNSTFTQIHMAGGSNSATDLFAFMDGTSYFQAKNNLAIISTGNAIGNGPQPYIFINSNSRYVGINTSNPQYSLDINGTANVSNTLNTGSVSITNSSSNILAINSKASQSTFGQIIFTNTSGTGDLRISGDGGDLFWQGGGGRTLQMAAYHGITLMGGRTTGVAPTFVNGSGSYYNTAILNTNSSIGLIIAGAANQTSDLMQLMNSSNTVISRANSNGILYDSNNNPPTRGNKINMLALSNSTGTYVPSIGTNTINVQVLGAGGGGGGATGNSSGAGGGGAGGNCIAWITGIMASSSYSYTIGTGGTGTTATGGTGGNSSITVNGVMYMGMGGTGGQVIASANSASLGGVGGGTSNGLILNYGNSGRAGVNGYYTVVSGTGGSTAYGQGGEGRLSAGPGSAGIGYGAGGGGAVRNTASTAGGAGANGIIIIEEYT